MNSDVNETLSATERSGFRFGLLLGMCIGIGAICLFAILSGCGTHGAAFGTFVQDRGSGYNDGFGVRVEATVGDGVVQPVGRIAATNATKYIATSGYTYSAGGGLRFGRVWFGEAGYVAYGYKSEFETLDDWKEDTGSLYASCGYIAPDWRIAATYYPPTSDTYDSDELRVELRLAPSKRFVVFAEPSVFRITLPSTGKQVTDTGLRAGVGVRW